MSSTFYTAKKVQAFPFIILIFLAINISAVSDVEFCSLNTFENSTFSDCVDFLPFQCSAWLLANVDECYLNPGQLLYTCKESCNVGCEQILKSKKKVQSNSPLCLAITHALQHISSTSNQYEKKLRLLLSDDFLVNKIQPIIDLYSETDPNDFGFQFAPYFLELNTTANPVMFVFKQFVSYLVYAISVQNAININSIDINYNFSVFFDECIGISNSLLMSNILYEISSTLNASVNESYLHLNPALIPEMWDTYNCKSSNTSSTKYIALNECEFKQENSKQYSCSPKKCSFLSSINNDVHLCMNKHDFSELNSSEIIDKILLQFNADSNNLCFHSQKHKNKVFDDLCMFVNGTCDEDRQCILNTTFNTTEEKTVDRILNETQVGEVVAIIINETNGRSIIISPAPTSVVYFPTNYPTVPTNIFPVNILEATAVNVSTIETTGTHPALQTTIEEPTSSPSANGTIVGPAFQPTIFPTLQPIFLPSYQPTKLPAFPPSILPTLPPSILPTLPPSILPTIPPSILPTLPPTAKKCPKKVLIAVDGTGSRFHLNPANPARAFTPTGKWRSHVANFWTDYKGSAYYWHGPDSAFFGAGKECQAIENGVVRRVCILFAECPDIVIDFVGHSRGGYILMEAARTLQAKGVSIRWMGLYDPVDSAVGYGVAETVSSNVKVATVAFSNPRLRSRWYFNTADHGPVCRVCTAYTSMNFWCTHSGVGGDPWMGDTPSITNQRIDNRVSENVDMWMRRNARKAGVCIPQTNRAYYGFKP